MPRKTLNSLRTTKMAVAILVTAGAAVSCMPLSQSPPRHGDWPTVFGPDGDSISVESVAVQSLPKTGPPEKYRIEVGTGYSSPVAVDGRFVIQHRIGDEELVSCFDIETGEPLWEVRYPTSYECVYEYTNGPYATPVIHNGLVYTMGSQWQARCLSLKDGSIVWQRDLAESFEVEEGLFGFGPGMVIEEGRLCFNLGAADAGVIALDATTGSTLWKSGRDRSSYTMPRIATIHGRRYLFVLTFEGLQALNPTTGEQYFFVPFLNKIPDSVTATSPIVSGDKVLLVTGPGPGCLCLQIHPDGSWKQVWRDRRVLDSQWNTLIERDGIVFGYTAKKQTTAFRAIELATGKLRWSWTSELERGTALLADDTFILWGEHGHLAFVDYDTRKHVLQWISADPLLETPTYSSPALHRGLLLLRNEGTVLCLSLRPEPAASTPATRR